ncbi:MAG: SulP family inorganic anion transporter [Chloroflexi bacterium]|nr:SulP family inorganic anion transporter [Chloroflexota bacterium]
MLLKEWWSLLQREFAGYSTAKFQKDLLAGLTVAAVALPLALAFGVASGADAAAGLVTAVLAGILIGFLGGAPYQISGPTGAMSAVLIVLAARYGLQGVWLAGLMAGLLILLLGILRLGRIVSLIPAPVISGFTSGIAVIIALGQLDNALGLKTAASENILEKMRAVLEALPGANAAALGITLGVAALMLVWPRFRISQRLPGSLVAILLATLAAALLHLDMPAIGAIPRTILLEQRLHLTGIDWSTLGDLVLPAMTIAALGSIESLLCGAVAGNMTGIRMHNSVELVGQGLGNILIPFFGGVPATAAIARTSVNVKSGGVTRLAPILHGVVLLVTVLLFAPLMSRIPLAALAGVLLVTTWRMNEWHAIRFYFGRRLKHAILAFLITMAATVFLDLTQAILIGFGISSLVFMAQLSELEITRQPLDEERLTQAGHRFTHPGGEILIYYISGPLFFAAARRLVEQVEAADPADATLILSLRGVPLVDATGIEVLREVWQRQHTGGGRVLLAALQPKVHTLLERAGLLEEIGAANVHWSADRAILSLGGEIPPAPDQPEAPAGGLAATLVITPHEERGEQKM